MRLTLATTSSAVKSEPSCHFTPLRSLNSQVVSFTTFHDSASSGDEMLLGVLADEPLEEVICQVVVRREVVEVRVERGDRCRQRDHQILGHDGRRPAQSGEDGGDAGQETLGHGFLGYQEGRSGSERDGTKGRRIRRVAARVSAASAAPLRTLQTEFRPERVDARLDRRVHGDRASPGPCGLARPLVGGVDAHLAAQPLTGEAKSR